MKQRKSPKLTLEQKECIEYPSNANLLVLGIPGSGKTTVLIERARVLTGRGETGILLLTYSSMLTRFVRQLSLKMPGGPVEVNTFHGWGMALLKQTGRWPSRDIVDPPDRLGAIRRAVSMMGPQTGQDQPPLPASSPARAKQALVEFLAEEFSWIKGLGKTEQQYIDEERTGRGSGISLQKRHKKWVWQALVNYHRVLKARNQVDFDDVAPLLLQYAPEVSKSLRPNHVLIDEAQDLTVMQLRAIKALTGKSLTIAADRGQSIYRRNFSWASVGIDIRGRSRSLTQSFRSTRQIIQLARSLQRLDPLVVRRDEEFIPGADPDCDGDVPELYLTTTLAAQVPLVVNWALGRAVTYPEDTVAIVAPTRFWCEKYTTELENRHIPYTLLRSTQSPDVLAPGIKVVTYYSAKGLEFDHVAVTCLREGTLPATPERGLSGEELEEFYATERRKVYVAITRGRLTVALFGAMPPSQFIGQMDHRLYRRVQ